MAKCRSAFQSLKQSQRLDDIASSWSDFLIAATRVYSKLGACTKGNGKSEAWFGRITRERRTDPLLQYIHQARNTDEHTVEAIVERILPQLTIAIGACRVTETTSEDGSKHIRIESLGGEPARASLTPSRFVLVPVRHTKYGDTFDPPKQHLGTPLKTGTPIEVAGLALSYLERIVNDARKLAE